MSEWRTMLVAVTGGGEEAELNSDQAFEMTAQLAEYHHAEVNVVRTLPLLQMSGKKFSLPSIEDIENNLIEIARCETINSEIEHGIEAQNTEVLLGDEAESIVREAQDLGANLIVIGDNMSGAWSKTAEKVLQHLPQGCDLLVCREYREAA